MKLAIGKWSAVMRIILWLVFAATPNFADLFRHSATYVDKILKGAKARADRVIR